MFAKIKSLLFYFQYHQQCQHFSDNEGDNKPSLIEAIQEFIFVSETVHLDDNGRKVKLGLLTLSHCMMYFHYHMKCQHFTDNAGDDKISQIDALKRSFLDLKWITLQTTNDN